MPDKSSVTVAEVLYGCYSNLAMAHAAVESGSQIYGKTHFAIRNRLYSGLRKGTMNIGALARDERIKIWLPQACCYCGSQQHLAVDHLVSRKRGGPDCGENMVWACRTCNSSKGAKDVLEWLHARHQFPSLLVLRRYLKLAIEFCGRHTLMDMAIDEVGDIPFSLEFVPRRLFPPPSELVLWHKPTCPATV
jgi:hypothetical protein